MKLNRSESFKNLIFIICILQILLSFQDSNAQSKEDNEEEKFINLGLISFSPKYIVTEDFRLIRFKIRNNTNRTISNMFPWIYKYKKSEDGKASDFILVNNPHQGGLIQKNRIHPPGKKLFWQFKLVRPVPLEKNQEYTLRVSPKSIFYSRVETGIPVEEIKKPGQ